MRRSDHYAFERTLSRKVPFPGFGYIVALALACLALVAYLIIGGALLSVNILPSNVIQ